MDLDYRVMPYPIARLFVEMLEEEDPRLLFRGLIKLFAGGIKYVSLIAIADYLRNSDSDEVNKALYQSMRRPSLGHWVGFLRIISAHYHKTGRSFHVAPLTNILAGQTTQLVDYLLKLRNVYVHPDIFPSMEESGALFDEASACLEALFSRFSFLSDYELIKRSLDGARIDILMGHEIDIDVEGKGRFYVCDEGGNGLDITPFLLISIDKEFKRLLVYETLLKSRAKYILGNKYDFVSVDGSEDNPVRQLKEIFEKFSAYDEQEVELQKQAAKRELSSELMSDCAGIIKPAHTCAHLFSRITYEKYIESERYLPTTYVERKKLARALQSLLDSSEKRMLVIVGDSGTGKSTEICRWYTEAFRNDITWFVNGRNIRASDTINVISDGLFDGGDGEEQLGRLLRELDRRQDGVRFVILFDGINETDDPRLAFRMLNEFVDHNDALCLKVICTCRCHSWNLICDEGILMDPVRFVQSSDGGYAHVIESFDDQEFSCALKKYEVAFAASCPEDEGGDARVALENTKVLKNPLILKFLFKAFCGREIRVDLSVENIMEAFTAERVRPQDMPLLTCYLMDYLFHRESDVLHFDELIESRDDAIFEKMEPENYDLLVEHICGDQVHSTEFLWFCPASDCNYHDLPVRILDDESRPVCPIHGIFLENRQKDNRSSYLYLLDENILAESQSGESVSARIVYDLYFEYLMSEYCIVNIHRGALQFDSLFQKAKSKSIFMEPLKSVAMEFWEDHRLKMITEVSADDSFEAYQILREILSKAALRDLSGLLEDITLLTGTLGIFSTFRRACIHALLSNPDLARAQETELLETLMGLLTNCDEVDFNDIGEYLVHLWENRVEIISPIVAGIADRLMAKVNIGSAAKILLLNSERKQVKGEINLLTTLVLVGLGKFYHDRKIQRVVSDKGLALIKILIEHPVLSSFSNIIARIVSKRIIKIYKSHGAHWCNFFEMGFQLDDDRETIRRFGRMFFVEQRNLFDLDYDGFYQEVHSENGLVTWYAMSVLPLHYGLAKDKSKAAGHLKRMLLDGTESDQYVVLDVLVSLSNECGNHDPWISDALSATETIIKRNPGIIFYHPQDYGLLKTSEPAEKHVCKLAKRLADDYNPYALPWIVRQGKATRRFYMNASFMKYQLLQMKNEGQPRAEWLIRMLKDCDQQNLLGFAHDDLSERRYTISVLIQAVVQIAWMGFIPEAFKTLDGVIELYLSNCSCAEYEFADVYRLSISAALMRMKEQCRKEVIAYIEKCCRNENLSFLEEVKYKAVEKEQQLNKTYYGEIIYQETFRKSGAIREAFGSFTIQAADASDAKDFINIYTASFVKWFSTLQFPETKDGD